jgi:hypothetical protein
MISISNHDLCMNSLSLFDFGGELFLFQCFSIQNLLVQVF